MFFQALDMSTLLPGVGLHRQVTSVEIRQHDSLIDVERTIAFCANDPCGPISLFLFSLLSRLSSIGKRGAPLQSRHVGLLEFWKDIELIVCHEFSWVYSTNLLQGRFWEQEHQNHVKEFCS